MQVIDTIPTHFHTPAARASQRNEDDHLSASKQS